MARTARCAYRGSLPCSILSAQRSAAQPRVQPAQERPPPPTPPGCARRLLRRVRRQVIATGNLRSPGLQHAVPIGARLAPATNHRTLEGRASTSGLAPITLLRSNPPWSTKQQARRCRPPCGLPERREGLSNSCQPQCQHHHNPCRTLAARPSNALPLSRGRAAPRRGRLPLYAPASPAAAAAS
jgi:hypothetical protein